MAYGRGSSPIALRTSCALHCTHASSIHATPWSLQGPWRTQPSSGRQHAPCLSVRMHAVLTACGGGWPAWPTWRRAGATPQGQRSATPRRGAARGPAPDRPPQLRLMMMAPPARAAGRPAQGACGESVWARRPRRCRRQKHRPHPLPPPLPAARRPARRRTLHAHGEDRRMGGDESMMAACSALHGLSGTLQIRSFRTNCQVHEARPA